MLSDLPGGPPDNQGVPDEEVIYDIVDEACQTDGGGDYNTDDSEATGVPQMTQEQRLGLGGVRSQFESSHLKPPRFQTSGGGHPQTQNRYPTAQQSSSPAPPRDIEVLTSQIRDALIVSALVYLSNSEMFHSLLGRIVPVNFKTVDEDTQLTIVNTLAVSLAIGAVFYLIKVYMEPPNIVLKLVQMYYA